MEIIQNRKTMKIISVLILMIMLISTITPVFAATKTANTLELRDTSVTVKVGRKGKIRIKTNTTGKDVIWSSSDKKKTVIGTLYGYPSGYVEFEALDVGTATVTATAGGKKATCKVEVTEGSSLKLGDLFKGGEDDKKTPELPSGGGKGEALTTLISTTFTGVTKVITSDEAKNAASGLGDIIMNFINSLLEGLRSVFSNIKQFEFPKGTDLPAETTGGESDENKTVEVSSVTISGATSVKVGEEITLTATVKPNNATNKTVTWSSSSNAATVGKDSGIVKGVTAGQKVTITATAANGKTDTHEISVVDATSGGGGTINNVIDTSSSKYTCKKYTGMTDQQKKQLAYVAYKEQGSVAGAKVELSLMANRTKLKGYSSVYNYVMNSGWFYLPKKGLVPDNPKVNQSYIDAVEEVLVNGNSYLPSNVIEHDTFKYKKNGNYTSDIEYIENNNTKYYDLSVIWDRSQYISGKTKIHNKYGATYVFFGFAPGGGDPFGG